MGLLQFQKLPQAALLQECVLGGDMTAGKDDEVTVFHKELCVLHILPIQDRVTAEGHAGQAESHGGVGSEPAGEIAAVGI